MHAAKPITENRKVLHELVPLNSLSPERFSDLLERIIIEEVKAGRYLFRKGDRDNQTIFLLEGTVNLIDGFRKVAGEVQSGTELSRHPISNLQPRQFAARAVNRSVIARIDSSLLDVFLTWDPSSAAEVVDIGAADNTDWMTRMLQSEAFVRLPPSKLQALLLKFKPLEVKKGQVIIAQGSEGDHFYTIHEGRCAVTRREGPGEPERALAELSSGDSFGEESLVSESRRNASVTMLSDGLLMRLAKQDFVDLLKAQLVKYVGYRDAKRMVEEGAVWLDVRTPEEYECGSFEDSVNIPLATLRGELPEMVFNAKYVICCDTGSRSDSAAFVLSHRGFDVCVLDGGMDGLSVEQHEPSATGTAPEAEQSGMQIRQQLEEVQAELERERGERQKVEQQLQLVRGELGESGERLGEYYNRVNRLEGEKQQFIDRFKGLQEKHAEQLQALSEELEQEKQQSHRLRKSMGGLQGECDSLRRELGIEQEQSEAQYLQLQQQLNDALAREQAPEGGGQSAQAGESTAQDESGAFVREYGSPGDPLHVELQAAREEAARLRQALHGVTGENRQLGEHLQQMMQVLETMRNSVHGISAHLTRVPTGDHEVER